MSTVYIPQEPMIRDRHTGEFRPLFNLEPAAVFGQLKILFDSRPVTFDPEVIVDRLDAAMAEFSDDDWIVCVGNPALFSTVVALASEKNDGRYKILQWDKHIRGYVQLQVDLHWRER